MKNSNFFFVSILILLISCSKDDVNNHNGTGGKGQIVFYTNAQTVLKCGTFNVDIYIDSNLVGSLSESYSGDGLPGCNNSASTLSIEHDSGTVNYSVKINCSLYGSLVDSILIKPDTCQNIFLDFNVILSNEQIITKHKLIGEWFEISPCDSCYTLTILESDTIFLTTKWNDPIEKMPYFIISKDSIKVEREIDLVKQVTKHQLIFNADDKIELKAFRPSDANYLYPFEDIILLKK